MLKEHIKMMRQLLCRCKNLLKAHGCADFRSGTYLLYVYEIKIGIFQLMMAYLCMMSPEVKRSLLLVTKI